MISNSSLEAKYGWTKELLKNLKILKAKAWRDTWLHKENASYLDNNYDWESGFAFCASFFSGIIQIFRSGLIYVQIIAILLNFISSFLQFHIKFKNYPTLIEKHKIATSRFSRIYNQINNQESAPIEKRQRGGDFSAWIFSGYETLHVTAPEVDDVVWDTYHRKFKDTKAYRIIEMDEFDISSSSSSGSQISQPSEANLGPAGGSGGPGNGGPGNGGSGNGGSGDSGSGGTDDQRSRGGSGQRSRDRSGQRSRGGSGQRSRGGSGQRSRGGSSQRSRSRSSREGSDSESDSSGSYICSEDESRGVTEEIEVIVDKPVTTVDPETGLTTTTTQTTQTAHTLMGGDSKQVIIDLDGSSKEIEKLHSVLDRRSRSAPEHRPTKRRTYDRDRLKYEMGRMDSALAGLQSIGNLYSMDHRCMIDDSEMRNPSFQEEPSFLKRKSSKKLKK